ncbi:MAG TPA: amidohydrolase [Woeseiaceae bacterium]|nr:amidohydrolase [Woeseiaceae bacterium]
MNKTLLTGLVALVLALTNVQASQAEDVDLIVKNGTVLTMNAGKEIFSDGVVIVSGNKIVEVGGVEILGRYSSDNAIDAKGGIIMPGMINTHTHASMSVFRSLADDVPDRLNRYIFPLENKMVSKEMVYIGAVHAAIEMAKGGVTTMVDMYLFEESAARAVKEIGLRGVMTQNIIKYPTADGKDGNAKLKLATALVEKYKNDELITPGYGPHAPHTVTKENLEKIAALSEKYDAPVFMHVAETQEEFDRFQSEFSMTPVEYLDSVGILNDRLIAAHCIFVTDSDIELMKRRGVGIAHNMVANIKSAKGVSPALKMFDDGLNIGLGTDGPMSGNTLDIIGQMGYVAKLHKLVNKDRSAMPPYKVVEMATMGGARAIHRDDELGSLERGKLADIVIVETNSTNMQPMFDPYSVLVYSANASNVDTVIVNGKVVVSEKTLLTYDEEKSRAVIQEFSKEVEAIAETL